MRRHALGLACTLVGVMGCQADERIVFSGQPLALSAPEALVVGSAGLALNHLASVAPPRTARVSHQFTPTTG